MILSCPPVAANRIDLIKSNLFSWLRQEALRDLVKIFGGKVPKNLSLNDLAKWYLNFSACWDFRGKQKQAFDAKAGEGVRWLLSNDDLSDKQKELTMSAALELGLMNNDTPAKRSCDYIWVLGGAKLSCLLRTRFAKNVIEQNAAPKAVFLLASMRPVGDAEREAADTYAPGAETEFDLFVAAAQKELGVTGAFREERCEDTVNANNSWVIRKYHSVKYDVTIVAAPSSEPQKRRANSADTYEFFFKKFEAPSNSSILLITSQIYVPYQHLEAVRTVAVPHKMNIDAIGFPAEWGGSLQGMNEPSNYLQEIRSTIQSAGRFLDEYGREY
jgi:hypothetical protein